MPPFRTIIKINPNCNIALERNRRENVLPRAELSGQASGSDVAASHLWSPLPPTVEKVQCVLLGRGTTLGVLRCSNLNLFSYLPLDEKFAGVRLEVLLFCMISCCFLPAAVTEFKVSVLIIRWLPIIFVCLVFSDCI